MNATLIELLFTAGLVVAALGILYLLVMMVRARRERRSILRAMVPPLGLILAGMIVALSPALFTRLVPVDLGPHDQMVDGERHLTLTGWDRNDYSVIRSRPDTIVLQMANADVDDSTMSFLEGLSDLRELDLSFTRISDQGLMVILKLPKLEQLRLQDVAVTDDGFRAAIMPHPGLNKLILQGTKVSEELKQEWMAAQPGRMAL